MDRVKSLIDIILRPKASDRFVRTDRSEIWAREKEGNRKNEAVSSFAPILYICDPASLKMRLINVITLNEETAVFFF